MNTFITSLVTWVKNNILITGAILIVVVLLFFPKVLRGLFGKRRVRHTRRYYAARQTRPVRRRRRPLPRSVGMHKVRRRKQYTKGGKVKKPWQIKGSLAAKRHMARIRRMR